MARGSDLKEVEEFPRRLIIFFIVIILLLIGGTLGFKIITGGTFNESFFKTIQTLAFIFNDQSTIYERLLEIFLAIVGVFLVWWVLWSVADMLLDGNLRKYLKTRFYYLKMKSMKDHVIIIGGGRVGEEIARVLSQKKKSFLIVESDSFVSNSLRKKGYLVIEGDASNEQILKKAEIEKASKIILTLPKTETNLLLTMTAKEMNSKIEVYSRCENNSLVSKLKKAGAKVVIVPEILAADKIANDLDI